MNYSACTNNSLGVITNVYRSFCSAPQAYSLAINIVNNAQCIQHLLFSADQTVNKLTFRGDPLGEKTKETFSTVVIN